LDSLLSAGISVNMYMFHGGTTRAFMNGANYNKKNPYEPQISSYDYDAPLDEAGNPTPKFMAFRSVIQKHLPPGETLPVVPPAKPVVQINDIQFTGSTSIFNILPPPTANPRPLTFEDLHQAYGFVLYRTTLAGGKKGDLVVQGLRDYALVFINGKRAGILDRRHGDSSIGVGLPSGRVTLDILVENLGRINFGPYLLHNKKGITGKVLFNNQELKDWNMYSLPFSDVNAIKRTAVEGKYPDGPAIRRGRFYLARLGDAYLDMSNWGKGVVWVNGYNLGRYWNVGPQQTIYVPVEWLKPGNNEIVVLELTKPQQDVLRGNDSPQLRRLQKDSNQLR
jgi:beta-galactosidase